MPFIKTHIIKTHKSYLTHECRNDGCGTPLFHATICAFLYARFACQVFILVSLAEPNITYQNSAISTEYSTGYCILNGIDTETPDVEITCS